MLIDIPGSLVKELYVESTDTGNKALTELSLLLDKTIRNKAENALKEAVNRCLYDLQTSFGIDYGDVAPDLAYKYDKAVEELVAICVTILVHQM